MGEQAIVSAKSLIRGVSFGIVTSNNLSAKGVEQ